MNKERQVIEPGTVVFFNGDVDGKELEGLSGKSLTVVINGNLYLLDWSHFIKGNPYVDFKGDLYVEGNIVADDSIRIDGNFTCNGEIKAIGIYVSDDLKTYDYIKAATISVGGNFYSQRKIHAGNITVVGDFESPYSGVSADTLTVLGRMHVTGNIEADEIKVGY